LLKKLSYERAKTVYDYLISQGLPTDQFSVYGLGNSTSVANNDSPEGRSTNRRIIIIREN
jgi:outer membrane protein OmpA-like peptidoglycan-associated protein